MHVEVFSQLMMFGICFVIFKILLNQGYGVKWKERNYYRINEGKILKTMWTECNRMDLAWMEIFVCEKVPSQSGEFKNGFLLDSIKK